MRQKLSLMTLITNTNFVFSYVWFLYQLVWGNGAPIPGFPRPRPEFSGTGRGWGQALQKFLGIFGDGDGLNFGVFWGFIPENLQKIIGEILGTGIGSSLGIYWGFPPKKPDFRGSPKNPRSDE